MRPVLPAIRCIFLIHPQERSAKPALVQLARATRRPRWKVMAAYRIMAQQEANR